MSATASSPAQVLAPPHRPVDDALAWATAVALLTFGLFLLHHVGAVTGGTAGLALLLGHLTPLPFPLLLVAVNVPFLLVGLRYRGLASTLGALAGIVLVSVLAPVPALLVPRLEIAPVYAVLLGNLCAGVGLLVLFRHRASLGGFGVLALLLQERRGWRAGWVMAALDSTVVLASLVRLPWQTVLLSALGAALLGLVVAVNHRPGRYLG